jgi:hypothetical protein
MFVIKFTATLELLWLRNIVAGVFKNKLSFSKISGSSNASSYLATDIHYLERAEKKQVKIGTFENFKKNPTEKYDFQN